MADFAGEICQDRGRLGRPSRQRRAPRAPWGLPTPNLRSTLGQPSVNPRSTFGQRSVSSLAIAGRFSLILPDSSIKTEDRRTCISQMVDFPIRKRDFRVRTWSGAFWEPLERKKEKTKCIYKIRKMDFWNSANFRRISRNFHEISSFLETFAEIAANR